MDTIKIDGIEYVDTNQAAKRIGLSARTLINARSEGRTQVPYMKHLGRVLYPLSEVERYVDELGRG